MTDPVGGAQSLGVNAALADPKEDGALPRPAPAPLARAERDKLFREIYGQCFDYVWSSLRRFGVWDKDLEDAVHEVFIVVHRRLDDYDRSRPIKPWLVGIAFRVASDFRRRASNRREIMDDEVIAIDPKRSQLEMVSEREARTLVGRALETLDDDKRLVFVLHEIEGRPIPEVAEITGAPLNTCYSRLRLARERFTEAVHALRGTTVDGDSDDKKRGTSGKNGGSP